MQVVVCLQQATCLRCLRRRHSLVGWFTANGQHLILLITSLNTLSLFELNTLQLVDKDNVCLHICCNASNVFNISAQ